MKKTKILGSSPAIDTKLINLRQKMEENIQTTHVLRDLLDDLLMNLIALDPEEMDEDGRSGRE